MDETFVKNSVMNAKIDPKGVMDVSIFKIGGWNILQPSNQISWVMQCYMRQHFADRYWLHDIQEDTHRGENPR